MKPRFRSFFGRCHCGNLEVIFETKVPPEQLPVRKCSCSFCSKHGARNTSDPQGSVQITIRNPEQVIRYRFGLKTADFLICKRCGVYVGAVMQTGERSYATTNVNTFTAAARFAQEPVVVSYEGETEAKRIARREANWTPVLSIMEAPLRNESNR